MRTELQGQIGFGNMKPTKKVISKEREGAHVQSNFMSFRMFTDDYSKPMVAGPDGKLRRQRMVVQVVLPDDDRSGKLFQHLYSGRRVLVRGNLNFRPNKTVDKNGKEVIYVNPTIRMDSLQFLDRAPEEEARKVISDLCERVELISAEDAKTFLSALNSYYKTLQDNGDLPAPAPTQDTENEFLPDDMPY
jgi:hypothetical protein